MKKVFKIAMEFATTTALMAGVIHLLVLFLQALEF